LKFILLIVSIIIILFLIDGLFIFNNERILLLPLSLSELQNFFHAIWKSFSVKSSFGSSKSVSLVCASTDFLKDRLAIDKDEISFCIGWLNSLSESLDSITSASGIISWMLFINSVVLIKDFFF